MGLPVPIECLQEIFEHLQNDLKSLYTILFVNKLWCINAIPILYRNPFILLNETLFTTHNHKDAFEIYGDKILLLLENYLKYLTQEQKLEWEEKGIKLPEIIEPSLFDYLSFLRILPLPELQHSILLWSNKIIEVRNNRKFIELEMNKLFLTKCKNINTLMIDESSELPELVNNSLPNFYNLNFICSKLLEISKLEKIIPHCDKIKVLSILRFGKRTSIENRFTIPKLINKPKALEKFYWESVKDYDELSISKSLEKHINSLTHIEIYTYFSCHIISIISKCKNLKTLRFAKSFLNNIPQFINDDDVGFDKFIDITPFTYPKITFPNLQELFFGGIPTNFYHFEILLKNTNHSLKKLGLGWSNSIDSLNLYCENLNFLNLKLSFHDFDKFFQVSELPKFLTKLVFNSKDSPDLYQRADRNINEFLIHLSNILPKKIKFIHLGLFYKNYSIDSLKTFLLNCQTNLEFPLELILPFDTCSIIEERNHIVQNFTKLKVLTENSWILFLYFCLNDCKNCSTCHGGLLNNEEDNPIEPFKEIILIKHCSCWKNHIECLVSNLYQDQDSEVNNYEIEMDDGFIYT
ncbi:hypothetical protein C1645_828449 [Glomus cerebriforme]|uniref:F-box domain-containing protein n=1 Tax=Glomus cerebriforme TaxID=658196 RepID=A0A397SW70_9GLOM|nr:hypothetical protein C1645_828449 [Glomus cerebriforme]